jgi:hypothetical protein
MYEDIGSIILADETVPLTVVEPLDLALYSGQRKPPANSNARHYSGGSWRVKQSKG